jgi:hypothetical protein
MKLTSMTVATLLSLVLIAGSSVAAAGSTGSASSRISQLPANQVQFQARRSDNLERDGIDRLPAIRIQDRQLRLYVPVLKAVKMGLKEAAAHRDSKQLRDIRKQIDAELAAIEKKPTGRSPESHR